MGDLHLMGTAFDPDTGQVVDPYGLAEETLARVEAFKPGTAKDVRLKDMNLRQIKHYLLHYPDEEG